MQKSELERERERKRRMRGIGHKDNNLKKKKPIHDNIPTLSTVHNNHLGVVIDAFLSNLVPVINSVQGKLVLNLPRIVT